MSPFLRAMRCVLFASVCASASADESSDRHVLSAERLVEHLTLSNTDYAHGPGWVKWTEPVESHTDCSGFIDQLLMHDDGYARDDFRRWLGSGRPTAERYHDAIVDGRGFVRIDGVGQLHAGDLIAIKYLTRHDNTGHIMLVVDVPRRLRDAEPRIPGTTQWAVTVIDSSESGHGPSDTRHGQGPDGRDHDGLGRGVTRLYADSSGRVAGFSWSTSRTSRFVRPEDEDVVLGRMVAGFRP